MQLIPLKRWSHLPALLRFVALAALLAVAALGERSAEQYFTAGVAYGTAALQQYPDIPANRYGVNAFLDEDVYNWQLQRDFSAIAAGGFGWVRQEFIWAQIEPDAKGNFYDAKNHVNAWAKWDRIVADAQQYHVKLIVRLDFAPNWATVGNVDSGQCPTLCPPPNNPQDFADFARAVATRYKGKIAAYQIWNEPNLQHEWAGKPISPVAYTALLKAGYTAIKAADPQALVLSAALAPNQGDSPANMSDLTFLRGMYAAGAQPYFDVLAANAYGLNHAAFSRRIGFHNTDFPRALLPGAAPFTFDRPLLLRQIMAANGDAGKAVWVTEFGWMSLPPNWRGNPSPWSNVSPAARQQHTLDAWRRAAEEWPWMGPLTLWYLRSPDPIDPRDPTPYFAILGQNWQPTPLYTAIQAQATAPAIATTGLHAPTDPAAIYGPHGFKEAWQAQRQGNESLEVAGAPGANMAFRFTGNDLWLRIARGPQGGEARITVDNVPGLANVLPADAAGDRILDTYAPTAQPSVLVHVASGLPAEPHELELEVLPAHNPAATGTNVALAGFGVTIEKPAIWSDLKAVLALAAALLFLWPATEAARRAPIPHPTFSVPDAVVFGLWLVITALFYFAPGFAPSAVLGLALLALGVWRPDLGVLLAPVVASLEFLPKQIHGSSISLGEALIGVCFAGWLLRCYWRRTLLVTPGPFLWVALGLLAVGFVSLFAAEFPRYSLRDYREVIIEPVLYFVVLTSLLSAGQVRRLVGVAIAGGAGVALLALVGYGLHRGVIPAEGVSRLEGIYPSPDNLALYLDRPLAMAGGLLLWSSGRVRRACALAVIPMAVVIVLTFARGAWVAIVATAVLAGLFVNRRLLVWAATAIVVAVAAGLVTQAKRLTSVLSFSSGSTTGRRVLLWRASWSMARDHPIQGVGLDNFLYQYPRYRLPGANSEPFLSHPHNVILDFWLSLGILGLVWLGWALLTIIRVARRVLKAKNAETRALGLGLTASLVVGAMHGLVDNSYFLPDLAVLFWLAVGGLQLLAQAENQEQGEKS